jgi:hypothetical protein
MHRLKAWRWAVLLPSAGAVVVDRLAEAVAVVLEPPPQAARITPKAASPVAPIAQDRPLDLDRELASLSAAPLRHGGVTPIYGPLVRGDRNSQKSDHASLNRT